MCGREAKFSLSIHFFSVGVYILFYSLNIVFIASLQSPFVLCDSRALPRTCDNRLWALAHDVFKQRVFSTVLQPLSQIPMLPVTPSFTITHFSSLLNTTKDVFLQGYPYLNHLSSYK
jgi:hypothetical protein